MVRFPCLAEQFHKVLFWSVFSDMLVQDKLLPCPGLMH